MVAVAGKDFSAAMGGEPGDDNSDESATVGVRGADGTKNAPGGDGGRLGQSGLGYPFDGDRGRWWSSNHNQRQHGHNNSR